MKTSEYIREKIDRLPKGYIFTYDDFIDEVKSKEALNKALNRMVSTGKIAKLSKGKFYKPETSPFGKLMPSQSQVVKDLLEEKGRVVGYLTGVSVYNKLGLTTQVSNIIQVGKNETRPTFKRERYKVSFIKQKNLISKENIPLLQILDAIKYIKKIPDSTVEDACVRLKATVSKLTEDEQLKMVKLALKYPPSSRALLGAMLDDLGKVEFVGVLKQSLNPMTKYKIDGISKVLANAEEWNIT